MKMSQPCPCSMRMQPCSHCRHVAMEISQPSQPIHPLQQWRCLSHFMLIPILMLMLYAVMQSLQPYSRPSHRDFSAFTAYAATASMEMSQPRSCFMRMQPWSHGDFSVFTACAVTAAMEMSQPYPCPCPCLLQSYSHCSHIVTAAI